MNVWDRKVLRLIENATENVDVETACKMLIMVLKQKALLLPVDSNKDAVIFTGNKLHKIPYELMRLFLQTEPLKSKL